MNLKDLSKPFNPASISWRVGATKQDKTQGIALAYIDARDVMERFDAVCGVDGWQASYPWSDGKKLCCSISVFVDGKGWVGKANGAGDSDVEAEKGAFSDAFKRAAVLWGVGQYLYSLPNTWVDLEPAGKSYKISKQAQIDLTNRLHTWQTKNFGAPL